ncbi:hypothetical protein WJX72_004597 [[Myrmecia] bisecta]|uniref:Phytocyanin domain-containing protein n=1 Tax=[Myrmecia] bisecta TaxID=41462 RepID=A0AAW1Q574_9CHLO
MLLAVAHARDIIVGGAPGWDLGIAYEPISATVGDVLVFKYASGQHNVFEIPASSCDTTSKGNQVAGFTQAPARVPLTAAGVKFYACSVPGHCSAGMLVTVNTSPAAAAPAPAPAAATGLSNSSSSYQLADDGFCQDPVLSERYPGAEVVVCYAPPIPMRAGQVVNDFVALPNPYPIDRQVAIVVQSLQLVNEDHQPVPLSEVYVHHVFGNFRFLPGEGAELRGSLTTPPLSAPNVLLVNGSAYVDPAYRISNIHLIQTDGVLADDLRPCIECWCQDANATGPGYLGGTACCSDSNCPVSTVPATNDSTYYVQFNTTYRPVAANMTPASTYMMDITGGNIEYDVHRNHVIGTPSIMRTSGPFDGRCPQTSPFQLLRCTGHLHIGGKCLRLFDDATGEVICSSCAHYGSSDSVDAIGNEHGYLVKMDSVDLVPPYTLQPGQNVTMEAEYAANTDHFGVMSLFFNILADWDESCPGAATQILPGQSAFGPAVLQDSVGNLNPFNAFEGKGVSLS